VVVVDAGKIVSIGSDVPAGATVIDLVAVDANPLDDVKTPTAPAFVMHEGNIVVAPTKLLR
jgi:imidazolonepropionase-like amidohydrolase